MPDAFAHRGLWAPEGPPENSLAAFRAAADAQVGIELDVQISKDGVPVVFHDPVLDRMTEETGMIWDRTAEELTALRLDGTDERIPTLSDVLRGLPQDLPVLVELKPSPGAPEDYLRAVDLALFGTRVRASVMSFVAALNSEAQAQMPDRRRGLLIPPTAPTDPDGLEALATQAEALGVSYLAPAKQVVSAVSARFREAYEILTWTVDDAAALEATKPVSDGIIFEHLDPALVIA